MSTLQHSRCGCWDRVVLTVQILALERGDTSLDH